MRANEQGRGDNFSFCPPSPVRLDSPPPEKANSTTFRLQLSTTVTTMADFREVEEGVTDVDLPEPRATFYVEFLHTNGHRRWAKVYLAYFQLQSQQFVFSNIKSVACCNSADSDKFDHDIDQIHSFRFGQGRWIKTGREHLPPLTTENPILSSCQNRRSEACQKLHTRKHAREDECDNLSHEGQHSRLKQDLFKLPRDFTSQQGDKRPSKKPKYSESSRKIKEAASGIKESLTELCKSATVEQQKEVKETIAQVDGAASIACFVQKVMQGVEHLASPRKSSDTLRFGRLVGYLSNRTHDDGTELDTLIDSIKASVSDRSKRIIFDYEVISGNIQAFRKFAVDITEKSTDLPSGLPPNLSELLASLAPPLTNATAIKERNAERNRIAKKHQIVNQIISGLHEKVGLSSLVIWSALKETGSKFAELRHIRNPDIKCFVSSAVDALSSVLQKIPDNVTVLHIPAIVAYLLGVDYSLACNALRLPQFAAYDFGIISQLKMLAEEFNGLSPNASDYRVRCSNIEDRATTFMSVPMSKLRSASSIVALTDGDSERLSSALLSEFGFDESWWNYSNLDMNDVMDVNNHGQFTGCT
ncbi:hypothetical protein CABS02_02688 [Colletotrichum abscissum]|uniref:Uncharacterized protein n=1 Tax=Colletotrichum abscissum TaxID=1671311 RepID=A0A9P9XMY5_9PEZI|nr:hypothetical protein CABS02_02688 [Colletotrichum abscissum]